MSGPIPPLRRIAIVGAGMAGLSCADVLVAQGHQVILFDKGRGPGGRMSTRRIATPLGEVSFDHGAQYFTARDTGFLQVVASWSACGLAQRWPDAGDDAWVGVPGMSALVRDMAERHQVLFGRLVVGVKRSGSGWLLVGENLEQKPFDAVLFAVPAEQAATLLAPIDLAMARSALVARSQPCWTAMFAFDAPIPTDAKIVRDRGPISWAARNSSKPGRKGPEAWVVQAGGSWTTNHLEGAPDEIKKAMLTALGTALAVDIDVPIAASVHRWRYAMSGGLKEGALWNSDINIGVCGDWLLGPRVECAWLSGKALADQLSRCSTGAPDPNQIV